MYASYIGLTLWNKSDFCCGWGTHYRQLSVKHKNEQQKAIAENRPDDAEIYRVYAKASSLIADKYHRVASNPLLPYPKVPLITEAELGADPNILNGRQ
ncbi:hypothetical protein [Gimesia aquarii]|nr:hypothetical protein [Gimesia aquarii]